MYFKNIKCICLIFCIEVKNIQEGYNYRNGDNKIIVIVHELFLSAVNKGFIKKC